LRAGAGHYTSVRPGFRLRNPRTGPDGEGGSGYADRPARIPAFEPPFQAAGSSALPRARRSSWSSKINRSRLADYRSFRRS